MASKYCKLKHFLTRYIESSQEKLYLKSYTDSCVLCSDRVNERQLQQAATPSTHSAGAKHFAQRLLPQVLYASVPQAQVLYASVVTSKDF